MRSGGGEKEWHEIKEKVQPRMKSVWQHKKWQTYRKQYDSKNPTKKHIYGAQTKKRATREKKRSRAHIYVKT